MYLSPVTHVTCNGGTWVSIYV